MPFVKNMWCFFKAFPIPNIKSTPIYFSSSGISLEEEEGALEIEDDRPDLSMSSAVPGPGLYSLNMELQEEAGLSGSWEHDLQEQYVSEGSVLGTWDNSMKSVLCFGEDYSNYIRRKSELPSIDIISSDMIGLQVRRDKCSQGG